MPGTPVSRRCQARLLRRYRYRKFELNNYANSTKSL
jgi:hypothetical protein